MTLRIPRAVARHPTADFTPDLPEPDPGPGELDAENCKSDGYDNQCRAGRHKHDDPQQQDGSADDRHRNTARNFIGQLYGRIQRLNNRIRTVRRSAADTNRAFFHGDIPCFFPAIT